MAWRLAHSIRKGELDNRQRGWVFGRIWLVGREAPIELNLRGNCLRDIAGSRIIFKNPDAREGENIQLDAIQEGQVGDMTASRRVKVLECSLEEAQLLHAAGEAAPVKIANTIYFEWFSDTNGRVVIESSNYNIRVDAEPAWKMTEHDEIEQAEANCKAIRDFIEKHEGPADEPVYVEHEEPLDEFQWERRLRESDEMTERYSELLEKFKDHPDCERIVAREMGWNWVDDALDAEERGVFNDPVDLEEEGVALRDPNPQTEGRDWIRTEEGRIKHPIAHRSHVLSSRIWHYLRSRSVLNGGRSEQYRILVTESRTLSSKLAGALDGLAYSDEADSGFIIAYLKRALKHLETALGAFVKVQNDSRVESARMRRFRSELFKLREDMINLMNVHRNDLGR